VYLTGKIVETHKKTEHKTEMTAACTDGRREKTAETRHFSKAALRGENAQTGPEL